MGGAFLTTTASQIAARVDSLRVRSKELWDDVSIYVEDSNEVHHVQLRLVAYIWTQSGHSVGPL